MHCILRVAKLKTAGAVAGSCRHTFRETPTPNADAARAPLNQATGARGSRAVLAALKKRLPAKRRKDAVLCLEYLITASPEFFEGKARSDYFRDSLAWLCEKHGRENVLSVAVHRDETTPHLVAYVVPLTKDGRLAAKDFVGGPKRLSDMQTQFHAAVGARHGLIRGIAGSKARHQEVGRFYASLKAAPALPKISGIDQLAAAVGIQTRRMALRAKAEQALCGRAGRAGQQTLSQLRARSLTLLADRDAVAERLKAVVARAGRGETNLKEREAEIAGLQSEVSRLRVDLAESQERNRRWADRMRSLAIELREKRPSTSNNFLTAPERSKKHVPQ